MARYSMSLFFTVAQIAMSSSAAFTAHRNIARACSVKASTSSDNDFENFSSKVAFMFPGQGVRFCVFLSFFLLEAYMWT
jgi:hypothetical protein